MLLIVSRPLFIRRSPRKRGDTQNMYQAFLEFIAINPDRMKRSRSSVDELLLLLVRCLNSFRFNGRQSPSGLLRRRVDVLPVAGGLAHLLLLVDHRRRLCRTAIVGMLLRRLLSFVGPRAVWRDADFHRRQRQRPGPFLESRDSVVLRLFSSSSVGLRDVHYGIG